MPWSSRKFKGKSGQSHGLQSPRIFQNNRKNLHTELSRDPINKLIVALFHTNSPQWISIFMQYSIKQKYLTTSFAFLMNFAWWCCHVYVVSSKKTTFWSLLCYALQSAFWIRDREIKSTIHSDRINSPKKNNTVHIYSNFSPSDPFQRPWVEPSPNWIKALKKLKWLWELHVYGFAMLFVAVAFYSAVCLIASHKTIFTRHRVHRAVMNLALLVAGFLRSLILFWDPYASSSDTTDLQLLFCIISWGISTACITSSFSIMLLIFLETTKTSLGPARLKNLPCLLSITLVNIFYLLVSD